MRVNVDLQPRDGLLDRDQRDRLHRGRGAQRAPSGFLDETLVTEQKTIRVMHGYGTGQLRRAIADLLKDHPLVASFHLAAPDQGGGGVTVVELKD